MDGEIICQIEKADISGLSELNWIPPKRITGYSSGGYAAVRAMLMYPEFFKVGISGGGNHDLRCYSASYGEKYNGLDASGYDDVFPRRLH